MSASGGDLVFVGDAHLDAGDPAANDFLRFLETIAPPTSRLVLAGDLFELWIGRRELEQPHHRMIASALEGLRRGGIVVRYLEGNHDFRVASVYEGSAFDDSSEEGIVERWGGHSLFAVHGDRIDAGDRRYRAWRSVSRSRGFWLLFNAIPPGSRLRLAGILRRALARNRRSYPDRLPEAAVRQFAAARFAEGHDAVVLGHFHVEAELRAEPPSPGGRILVLPEWRTSRRHLRVGESGEIAFVDSPR